MKDLDFTFCPFLNFFPFFFVIFWIFIFAYSVFAKILCKKSIFAIPLGFSFSIFYFLIKSYLSAEPLRGSNLLGFVFFTSLILSTISDLDEMTVPRIASIWLVPFWLIFAKFNFLSISFLDSVLGALLGYLIPLSIAKTFKFFKGKEGLGLGDIELFSMIGAFLGAECLIMTLNGASISCLAFYAIKYFIFKNISHDTNVPFAPFISLGAIIANFFCC